MKNRERLDRLRKESRCLPPRFPCFFGKHEETILATEAANICPPRGKRTNTALQDFSMSNCPKRSVNRSLAYCDISWFLVKFLHTNTYSGIFSTHCDLQYSFFRNFTIRDDDSGSFLLSFYEVELEVGIGQYFREIFANTPVQHFISIVIFSIFLSHGICGQEISNVILLEAFGYFLCFLVRYSSLKLKKFSGSLRNFWQSGLFLNVVMEILLLCFY